MNRFVLLPLALALLCSSPARCAPGTVERAFKEGNALLLKHRYALALAQYKIVLRAEPNEPSALWNGGSAAYFARDFKTASLYFARLQKQEPQNGHLLAKRLQTVQELGDLAARDQLRSKLFALHRSGKDATGYAAKPMYCRDQFVVGQDQVLAYEFFELKPLSGKRDEPFLGPRFNFFVVAPDQSQKMRIECGWSSLDVLPNGTFIPSHDLPAFYYDAYYPIGPWARRTFGLGPTEPSFEQVKAEVVAIIEGRGHQVSGEKRE